MADKTELEKCKLLNDSILVKLIEEDNTTKSGLILSHRERVKGKVVKTGPGIYNQELKQIPMQIKVGDVVLLPSKDQFKDINLDGETYKFTNEREVTLVLESVD